MKKMFLMLVVTVFGATATFAQNTLVATLTHEDNISVFYGSAALKNAVAAAADGDIITLSGGSFQSANITKGITIRGTGVGNHNPTKIIVDYDNSHMSLSQEDCERLVIEGVTFTCSGNSSYGIRLDGNAQNVYFIKCYFMYYITFESSSALKAKFVNCRIENSFQLQGSSNVTLANSYIRSFSNMSSGESKAEFYNCVLNGANGNYYRSTFVNCFLMQSNYDYGSPLPAECIAMNTICCPYNNFTNMESGNKINCTYVSSDLSKIFLPTSYTSYVNQYNKTIYTLTFPCELTEMAKTTYLGTDGTEIGLYGGQYPFTFNVNYPTITKMDVAKQTTVDNKLSVDIEVKANE